MAGENPNSKLAMHVIASEDYLDCEDLVPAACESINVDVSLEELTGSNGYGVIALLAYDIEGISALEFALSGWPTGRGAPPLDGPYWCFDGATTFGDHLDDGGATGLGECAEPDSSGLVLLGCFYFGPVDSSDVPITFNFLPSIYTAPEDSILAVTDCTADYVTDEVVSWSGCTVGGSHSGTSPDCGGGQDGGGGSGGGEGDSAADSSGSSESAVGVDPSREVVVMFREDNVRLPDGQVAAASQEVEFSFESLDSTLKFFGATYVRKAFPGVHPEDATGVTPDGRTIRLMDRSRIYVVGFPDHVSRQAVVEALSKDSSVVYAEVNGIAIPDCVPGNTPSDSDFQIGWQWGLYNCADSTHDVNALSAWQMEHGHWDTQIAVVDCSIWGNHDDLYGKVSGDTFSGGDHGTHVACIASAKANNGLGVVGLDWHAKIIDKDIMWEGCGVECAAQKVEDAVDDGAHIINCSWSLDPAVGPSITLRGAFAHAYKLDRVSVASCWDHPDQGPMGDPYYPQAYGDGIIAVGATDQNDEHPSWSNWGSWVDVAAPGANIWSCYPKPPYKPEPTTSWKYASGTSMAAPLASGLAGLILSFGRHMDLHNDDVEQIIQLSAEDVNADQYPGWDEYLGMGRIDAHSALAMLAAPCTLYHGTGIGQTWQSVGLDTIMFFSVNGLTDGELYAVDRLQVSTDVEFPATFAYPPNAWGTGAVTVGFSDADTNFGMGWCEVVPGTVTRFDATLRTHVYKVWDLSGSYKGYFPCQPSEASLGYSAVGLPGRVFYDDCGSVTNEPHFVQGTAHTCDGPEPIEDRTLRLHTNEVLYHYTDLDPTREYEVTVLYFGCIDGLEVNHSLWADDQQLHEPRWVPQGRLQYSNLEVDPAVYADGEFMLRVVKEAREGGAPLGQTVAAISWILVEERGTLPFLSVDESSGSEQAMTTPRSFAMAENYPNPFNPVTTITYSLPTSCHTTVDIYNVQGQRVAILGDGVKLAGRHRVTWNADHLPSGIYFCRMRAGSFTETRKILLVR